MRKESGDVIRFAEQGLTGRGALISRHGLPRASLFIVDTEIDPIWPLRTGLVGCRDQWSRCKNDGTTASPAGRDSIRTNQALSSGDADQCAEQPGYRICSSFVTNTPWLDDSGLVTLPTGARVRGRRSSDSASPADFALVLGECTLPAWPNRRIRWRDFWIPSDSVQALDALRDALRRAHEGERVEVICRGGIGRTGTALAALAILDGLSPEQAVTWIRDNYHPRAVETLWQQRWLGTVQ